MRRRIRWLLRSECSYIEQALENLYQNNSTLLTHSLEKLLDKTDSDADIRGLLDKEVVHWQKLYRFNAFSLQQGSQTLHFGANVNNGSPSYHETIMHSGMQENFHYRLTIYYPDIQETVVEKEKIFYCKYYICQWMFPWKKGYSGPLKTQNSMKKGFPRARASARGALPCAM